MGSDDIEWNRTNADKITECRNSKECAPAKHHYDECVERVTSAEGTVGPKEDCVEECKFSPVSLRASREAWRGSAEGRTWALTPWI